MKVAFLGNMTLELIAREFELRSGATVYCSGYNQYQLEVLNPDSKYYAFEPDFSLFLFDGPKLLEGRSLTDVKAEIERLYEESSRRLKHQFLVNSLHFYGGSAWPFYYNTPENLKQIQAEANLFLNEQAARREHFYVLDLLSIIERRGYENLYDDSLWAYGKVRFNKKATGYIVEKLRHLMRAINGQAQKCLVVDLDNTLWGGVLGEEGIQGITLGLEGVGEVYRQLQMRLKEMKNQGVLLAICSKNDESQIQEAFQTHLHMPLQWDDFILKKINWLPKDENVRAIARELNIGEESLVFIDDQAFERELVKKNTMAVVPEFPAKPEQLLEFIADLNEACFAKFNTTEDDRMKTRQYFENQQREVLRRETGSVEDFVRSLELSLTIGQASKNLLPRLSQLTQKTNQFNLTTKRYTEPELEQLMQNPGAQVLWGRVKDRLGDYGIVLLLIGLISEETAVIDTFLMSCRVIGRFVEDEFLAQVIEHHPEVKHWRAAYDRTPKNSLVENLYDQFGFTLEGVENGRKQYRLTAAAFRGRRGLVNAFYEE